MMLCALVFAGCGSSGSGFSTDISKELTHERSAEITAATGFSIDYYNDGYKLISIDGFTSITDEVSSSPKARQFQATSRTASSSSSSR